LTAGDERKEMNKKLSRTTGLEDLVKKGVNFSDHKNTSFGLHQEQRSK
jgi:hypothetical protein